MNGQNDSNVAIKLNHPEPMIFELDDELQANPYELDPRIEAVATENVPSKLQPKPVSRCLLFCNAVCNLCPLLLLLAYLLGEGVGVIVMVPVTVSAYLVYLGCMYHFSSLLPLARIGTLEQYKQVFQRLAAAKCCLKFRYVSSRSRIDEDPKIYEQEYPNVKVVDRSGVLYDVEKHYSVVFVQYRKKYLFSDSAFKNQVHNDFNAFVEKQRREHDAPEGRAALRSKERIEFVIDGMVGEMGFAVQADNCYRGLFIVMVVLGLGGYFEKCMQGKILRYQIEIVKEVWPQQKN